MSLSALHSQKPSEIEKFKDKIGLAPANIRVKEPADVHLCMFLFNCWSVDEISSIFGFLQEKDLLGLGSRLRELELALEFI